MSREAGGVPDAEPGTDPSESEDRGQREQYAAAGPHPSQVEVPVQNVFEEEPTRVFCKFPGCGKSYASNDGVRKHAKRYHVQWLMQMDAKKEPVSDTVPPEGWVGDEGKPMPPKRARIDKPAGGGGTGGSTHPELPYGPAATLAGMAAGGMGRPPLGPGAHGAALALAGARGANVGGGVGGACGGGYTQQLYGAAAQFGGGAGRRQQGTCDPYPANPRNPVLPLSGRNAGDGGSGADLGGLEGLGASSDDIDASMRACAGSTDEGLAFWTHSMPPIKRGPSLLNQIEDEFDGRVADPGTSVSSAAALPLPLISQQQPQHTHAHQQPQQGEVNAHSLQAHTWAGPRSLAPPAAPNGARPAAPHGAGGNGGANGGEPGQLASASELLSGSLSLLTGVAAAAAPAAPGGAGASTQLQMQQLQMQQQAGMMVAAQQMQARAYEAQKSAAGSCGLGGTPGGTTGQGRASGQPGYCPSSGAAAGGAGGTVATAAPVGTCGLQPPTIAPNPSEASLFLSVLDQAEPSAAGPALRRDNSVVAHAAHEGRVPAGSELDEFK